MSSEEDTPSYKEVVAFPTPAAPTHVSADHSTFFAHVIGPRATNGLAWAAATSLDGLLAGTASLLSAATVVLIIVGMNMTEPTTSSVATSASDETKVVLLTTKSVLSRWFTFGVTWAGSYLALLFVMTVRNFAVRM